MVKFAIPALLFGLAVFPPPAFGAADWAVYRDSVHECQVEYPTALFHAEPYDLEKDYQRFSGPGNTFFRVKGVDNEENLTPAQVKSVYLDENAPGDVTYETTKSGFLVVSGFRDGNIFYTRVALSADKKTLCIVELSYPRKDKRTFDDIVTRMSRSFRAGN